MVMDFNFFNIALYIGKFISILLFIFYYLKYIVLLRLIKIDKNNRNFRF